MAEEYKITSIQFKRGTKAVLEARLIATDLGIPVSGEPIWEIDTNKLKIGNGVDSYVNLPYLNGGLDNNPIYRGCYLNGKFYTNSTYTVELPKSTTALYIDVKEGNHNAVWSIYSYNGTTDGFKPSAPDATENIKGLIKLYSTPGNNEDGTMNQKVITDGVKGIKFALETTPDEDGDGIPENVLVLNIPWNNL